jgi:LysM repeat protein
MMKYVLMLGFILLSLPLLFSQNTVSQSLAGYWKMNSTGTLLKIVPNEGCAFTASFKENAQQHQLTGMFYDGQVFSMVENSTDAKKFVYTGRLENEGFINGNYYASNCQYGVFSWIKVCDEYGNPLIVDGEEMSPCVAQARGVAEATTMTTTQRVRQKVVEKTEYVGEPRNESLPLVETTSFIPDGAIYVGNIGLQEKVTYREVEVEVPVAQPEVCLPKTETSNERGFGGKKKFSVCDAGTTNPTGTRAVVIPGKKVEENGTIYHIVGQGETMFSIAKRYGITVQKLAEINEKDCEHLLAKEKLRVSEP